MQRGWAAILVATLAIAPFAEASHASLSLIATGPITFSPRATAQIDPIGALILDTANVSSLNLRFPSVTLCHYQHRYVTVGVLFPTRVLDPTSPPDSCYPLTNVTITTSQGDQSGWLGIVAGTDASMQLSADAFQASPHTVLTTPRASTAAGTTQGASDTPGTPEFHREYVGANINGTAQGNLSFEGSGEIKFLGPDVTVTAAENTTTIRTGDSGDPAQATGTQTKEWIDLNFTQSNVMLDSAAPILLAAKQVTSFAVDGRINLDTEGNRGELNGTFAGSAMPTPGGEQLNVGLVGDVRSSTISSIKVAPASPVRSGIPLWAGLVGLGLVVGAGATVLIAARRGRPGGSMSQLAVPIPDAPARAVAEEALVPQGASLNVLAAAYAGIAMSEADQQRWESALHYYRKAAQADASQLGTALHESGIILRKLGRRLEALSAFEEAMKHRRDGDPEFHAALLEARDHEEYAEQLLLRALDRVELHEEVLRRIVTADELAHVRELASVQEALAAARSRLGLA